ncbi:MAG TPA: hypothetical protein PKW37_08260 [Salinivirgaceae bacterium]|nr:hypothetical protein [Salinivirgaceae bacterium]
MFPVVGEVVIRTNGGTLTVNAPADTVNHYAMLNEATITAVAETDCYHEYGTVKGQLNITKGKVVLESKANVGFVNVTATTSDVIAIEIKSGADYGRLTCENETILAAVATASNVPTEKTMKTEAGTVAIVDNIAYTDITSAISTFEATKNSTFELFVDIKNAAASGNQLPIKMPEGATFDGHGYSLEGNVALYINSKGGTVKNLTFHMTENKSTRSQAQVDRYGEAGVGTLSSLYGIALSGKAIIEGCTFDTAEWDALQITPVAGAEIVIKNNVFNTSKPEMFGQIRWIHIQSNNADDFAVSIKDNDFYEAKNLLSTAGQAVEIYYPVNASKVEISGNYFDGVKSASDVSKADLDGYYACIGTGGTFYNNANELLFNGLRTTPNNK